MLIWVLFQLSLTSVLASVVFEDCGSAYDLYAVNIDGCGWSLPCYVTLGEDVPVGLKFRADFESKKLDQNVVININHVNLRTNVTPDRMFRVNGLFRALPSYLPSRIKPASQKPFWNTELCDSASCPVRTDGLTSFHSVMTVPDKMALNQRGYLRWRIYNESRVQVLCYSVMVQTQSYLQKLMRSQHNHLK